MFKYASKVLFSAALCLAVLIPHVATAQEKENMAKIAEYGGGMHAMAEECGSYSTDQLKEMKAGQHSSSSAGGLSAEEFDTLLPKVMNIPRLKLQQEVPARSKPCASS